MDRRSETSPLLPPPVTPSKGYHYLSVTHSNDHAPFKTYDEEDIQFTHSEKKTYRFIFSLRSKLFLAMVAIPAYLLVSSALHSVGNRQIQKVQTDTTSNPFGSILGPVITANFPDPAIIWDNGVSYAFATNNRGIGGPMRHVQMATSTDNQTWTLLPQDVLPQVGAWETGASVWAPDVVKVDDGTFVMYYTDGTSWSPAHHCLGVATSKSVTGPYVPSDQPWACPEIHSLGGAIDPDGFLDGSTNRRYVSYKVDGNSIGNGGTCSNAIAPIKPTPIMLQEVSTDGITKIGEPVEILDRDEQDGPLIEAPALYRSDEGVYFLFYSSNCFTTPLYDTAYATALNITGPYARGGRPLLISGDGPDLVGPGGLDIIPGGNMVAFHGHMTLDNSPAYKKAAQDRSKKLGKPVKDVHLPLTRGMYSGIVTFNGREVTLVKTSNKH
jgi:Glycosyl hydrolases family 43